MRSIRTKQMQFSNFSITLVALVILHSYNTCTAAFVNNLNHISKCRSDQSYHLLHPNDNCNEGEENILQRRTFLSKSVLPATSFSLLSWMNIDIPKAQAMGLVKFPCKDYEFLNTYHFVRAGESLLEEEGIWSTNPLFLTNRESALSPNGIGQIEKMSEQLRADDIAPTIVRYSLAASAIDSSNVIGRALKVGRDRLVPEFNFMDPRAIGTWDMSLFNTTRDAVWAMDFYEAGVDGTEGRPPSNEDGTPHETLQDQVVRLRQLLSVLETQYSGDTILLVFPDGTGPALLTCLIGGVPLNRVHELEYQSGEVRLNVNYNSAHAYLSNEPTQEYTQAIARGRSQLKSLRDNPDEVQNVRDRQYAEQLRKDEEKREEQNKELEMQQAKQLRREEEKKLESIESKDTSVQVETTPIDSNMLAIGGLTAISAIGSRSLFGKEENKNESLISTDLASLSQNSTGNDQEVHAANNTVSEKPRGIPDSFATATVNFEEIVTDSLINEQSVDEEMPLNPLSPLPSEPAVATSTLKKPLAQAWDPGEDDGGLAWLGALSEMINEDDEESDNTFE